MWLGHKAEAACHRTEEGIKGVFYLLSSEIGWPKVGLSLIVKTYGCSNVIPGAIPYGSPRWSLSALPDNMLFLGHLKNWFQLQLNKEIKDTRRQLESNSGELRWVDYFSAKRAWDCGLINSVEFYFLCTLHLPCINVLSSPRVHQEHKKIIFCTQATGPKHPSRADEIAAPALGLSNGCPGLSLVTAVTQKPLLLSSWLSLPENTLGCVAFP